MTTAATSPLASLDVRLPGVATLDFDDPDNSGFLLSRDAWDGVFGFITTVVQSGPLSWCAPYQPIYQSTLAWRPCLQIIGGYVAQSIDADVPDQIASCAGALYQAALAANQVMAEPVAAQRRTRLEAALATIEAQLKALATIYTQSETLAVATATEFRQWTTGLLEAVIFTPAEEQTLATELAQAGQAALFEALISVRDGVSDIAAFSLAWESYMSDIAAAIAQIAAMRATLADAPSLTLALPQAAADAFQIAFEQCGQAMPPLTAFQAFWRQSMQRYPDAFASA